MSARAYPEYECIRPRDTSYTNVQIPINTDIFEGGSKADANCTNDQRLWPPPCPSDYIRDDLGNLPTSIPQRVKGLDSYERKVTFSAPTTANSSFQTTSSRSYVRASSSKQAPKARKDPLRAFSPKRSTSGYDASTGTVKQPRK